MIIRRYCLCGASLSARSNPMAIAEQLAACPNGRTRANVDTRERA